MVVAVGPPLPEVFEGQAATEVAGVAPDLFAVSAARKPGVQRDCISGDLGGGALGVTRSGEHVGMVTQRLGVIRFGGRRLGQRGKDRA